MGLRKIGIRRYLLTIKDSGDTNIEEATKR